MKDEHIEIGEVYAAKISGRISPVRIKQRGDFNRKSFVGINLATNKKVFIRTAQRLRFKLVQHDGQWRKCVPAIADAKLNQREPMHASDEFLSHGFNGPFYPDEESDVHEYRRPSGTVGWFSMDEGAWGITNAGKSIDGRLGKELSDWLDKTFGTPSPQYKPKVK